MKEKTSERLECKLQAFYNWLEGEGYLDNYLKNHQKKEGDDIMIEDLTMISFDGNPIIANVYWSKPKNMLDHFPGLALDYDSQKDEIYKECRK